MTRQSKSSHLTMGRGLTRSDPGHDNAVEYILDFELNLLFVEWGLSATVILIIILLLHILIKKYHTTSQEQTESPK